MLFRHNGFQRRNFDICDTFLAVGEVLNFTKTAARLRFAQPALSRQSSQRSGRERSECDNLIASHGRYPHFRRGNKLSNTATPDVSKRWPPNNKTNNIQRCPGISMAAWSLCILSYKAFPGSYRT